MIELQQKQPSLKRNDDDECNGQTTQEAFAPNLFRRLKQVQEQHQQVAKTCQTMIDNLNRISPSDIQQVADAMSVAGMR